MATFELLKTNPNCSNIYFIDENLCAGNTLDVINGNLMTLSSNLIDLTRNASLWDSIYSDFIQASGLMLSTIFNVQNINSTVNQAYSCVQTISGNWCKQFSLYFPLIYSISQWSGLTDLQKDSQILNPWLTSTFPPDNFPDYQIVNLYVSTNQDIPFQFSFSRSWEENCAPNGGSTSVSCDGCGSGNQGSYRSAGCNHHGGAAGYGACDNAYTHCGGPTSTTKDSSTYTCIADGGGRTLTVGLYDIVGQGDTPAHVHPPNAVDTCFARIYSYKYIKTYNEIDGALWNIIL
jgi:hypothetical protein